MLSLGVSSQLVVILLTAPKCVVVGVHHHTQAQLHLSMPLGWGWHNKLGVELQSLCLPK